MDEGSNRSTRWVVGIAALLIALLVAWRMAPRWRAAIGPEPTAAYVVVEPEGAGVASDGLHRIRAGTGFRLHAVLEASTLTGDNVWYTEAPALRLGDREIPADRLRRWPEGRRLRVRWMTVEGAERVIEPDGQPRLLENFHPEWGTGWTAAGTVDPALVVVEPGLALRPLPFGTQRFAVRLESYDSAEAIAPVARWSSPSVEVALAEPQRLTTVVAAAPPPLERLTGVAGAMQHEAEMPPAGAVGAPEWPPFSYSAPRLLAEHLLASGRTVDDLAFRTVTLGPQGPVWETEVAPGDLLRAGERIVIVWADADGGGRLDPSDIVLDLGRGMRLARASSLFAGDDELRLDLARLND